MIVRLFPSDRTGCGFYRMLEPGRVVVDATTEVEIQVVFDPEDELGLEVTLAGRLGNEKVVKVQHPGCDVVVLQRPAHRHVVEAIPHLQAHGVAVVCDYDDDFDSIDPRNTAWSHYEPSRNPMQNKIWAKLGSQLADLVTVTTPALAARYGQRGLVDVVPNFIPESYLDAKSKWSGAMHATDAPRVGWAGSIASHPGDLEVMGKAFGPLHDRVVYRTVGNTNSPAIVGAADAEVLDWAPLGEFFNYVASFDVGLVPLRDSTFNRSKSWLKGLEYAALGVPFIASPTAEYKRLAGLGAGDVVRTTTPNRYSWVSAIGLMLNDDYRERRAAEGRAVAETLTYERNAERWLTAWRNALTLRRSV